MGRMERPKETWNMNTNNMEHGDMNEGQTHRGLAYALGTLKRALIDALPSRQVDRVIEAISYQYESGQDCLDRYDVAVRLGVPNPEEASSYKVLGAVLDDLFRTVQERDDQVRVDIDEAQTVANAMMVYGGGFVSALGHALLRADGDNTRRIAMAFPEYWAKYLEIGQAQAQRE